MANREKHPPVRKREMRTPITEWVLGGIGIVLLAACIVFLVYEGLNNGEEPGRLGTAVMEIVAAGEHHVVTFRLHNSGSQTLSNLRVSARLLDGEREIERATTVIDYLPGRSSREGGFYFKHDPHDFKLEIAPEGYQKP
jgi:uncharacterized protein (TIGR02588 family)